MSSLFPLSGRDPVDRSVGQVSRLLLPPDAKYLTPSFPLAGRDSLDRSVGQVSRLLLPPTTQLAPFLSLWQGVTSLIVLRATRTRIHTGNLCFLF